jgi:hypothetical protein
MARVIKRKAHSATLVYCHIPHRPLDTITRI